MKSKMSKSKLSKNKHIVKSKRNKNKKVKKSNTMVNSSKGKTTKAVKVKSKNKSSSKTKLGINKKSNNKSKNLPKQRMTFVGTWFITEMEEWSEDAFNTYEQANVIIKNDGTGDFSFCLVNAHMNGEIVYYGDGKRWEFTFEGSDEYDPVSGRGWIKLLSPNSIKGKIKFHSGDSSLF